MPSTREEFLIVENCLSIRTSMSLVLDDVGIRARTAGSGFAALRQVRQAMPDVRRKFGAEVRWQMRLASATQGDKKEINLCAKLPKQISLSEHAWNSPMA
jgi:CheY-like chemotaxis protein